MTRRVALALTALAVLWFLIATAVAAGYLAGVTLAASRPAPIAAPPSGDGMTTERLVPLPSPDGSGQGEGPDDHPGPSRAGLASRPVTQPSVVPPRSSAAPTAEPRTAKPSAAMTPAKVGPLPIAGVASTYGPGWDGWLALPEGPGVRVRVCGAGGCVVRTSTDAGPSLAMQRDGRIVDLSVPDFEAVCGCSWRTGLIRVTVEYLP